MADFTTRVELHSAEWADYEILHKFMETEGFARTIKGNSGRTYHMPQAEYDLTADLTTEQVLRKAQRAADRTGCKNGVFVTKASERMWIGLKEVVRQTAKRY